MNLAQRRESRWRVAIPVVLQVVVAALLVTPGPRVTQRGTARQRTTTATTSLVTVDAALQCAADEWKTVAYVSSLTEMSYQV